MYIVILPVSSMSNGRQALERLENNSYFKVQDFLNELCFDEDDPCNTDDVVIMPISDYMDACNNDDISTYGQSWIGYFNILPKPKQ